MKTLIFSSQTPLYLSNPPPWKPKSPTIPNPTTLQKLNHSTITTRPHAKGFTGNAPVTTKETIKESKKNNNNYDEEELPEVVVYRIIGRILAFVGLPMALGLALLKVFGSMKEQNLWDVPRWVPFMTTLITFGASTMGIAYGSLSSSWDPEKKGSILGFEQAQKNWVEVWKEDDESQ